MAAVQGGMALETPEETFRLMDVEGAAIGWQFFLHNLEVKFMSRVRIPVAPSTSSVLWDPAIIVRSSYGDGDVDDGEAFLFSSCLHK